MNGKTRKKRLEIVKRVLEKHKGKELPAHYWLRNIINKELNNLLKIKNVNELAYVFKALGLKKKTYSVHSKTIIFYKT